MKNQVNEDGLTNRENLTALGSLCAAAEDAEKNGIDVREIAESIEPRRQEFQTLNRDVMRLEAECSRRTKTVDDLKAKLTEAKTARQEAANALAASIQSRNIDEAAARSHGAVQAGDLLLDDLESQLHDQEQALASEERSLELSRGKLQRHSSAIKIETDGLRLQIAQRIAWGLLPATPEVEAARARHSALRDHAASPPNEQILPERTPLPANGTFEITRTR